jgi:hypothetical protein
MRSIKQRVGRPSSAPTDPAQYVIEWSEGGTEPAPVRDATAPARESPDGKAEDRDVQVAPSIPERRRPSQVRGRSKSAGRPRLRDQVRALLTERLIPFVDVDEAKRALFQSAKLRSFHIVAYSKEGPNWLIFAASVTAQSRRDMTEWEKVFGEGFMAVLATWSDRESVGIRFRTLARAAVYLPGTEPTNPMP